MTIAILLAVALVTATFMLHYKVLQYLARGLSRPGRTGEFRVLVMILAAFVAHMAEIILYAATYAASVEILDLGAFGGLKVIGPLDYLYYSMVTYTSLGLGDVFPGGHLRLLTGVEALNGLLLITWSASFTYLAMGRLWQWDRGASVDSAAESNG